MTRGLVWICFGFCLDECHYHDDKHGLPHVNLFSSCFVVKSQVHEMKYPMKRKAEMNNSIL